jgi:hypothetical protein
MSPLCAFAGWATFRGGHVRHYFHEGRTLCRRREPDGPKRERHVDENAGGRACRSCLVIDEAHRARVEHARKAVRCG